MAFGDLKVQDLIYEDSSNNEITVVIADLATKANPTFTGTVTVPTATAGDNSTKAASTAFVVASFAPKAAPAFTGNATGVNLTLSGNLTVNGTTTTIDTTTLQVEDKNIEIGKVSTPSNATADGGGITLLGGSDGDKTINWVNATDAWTSSEHIVLAANKRLLIGTTTEGEVAADNLTIADSGPCGITIRSGTSDNGQIFFSDGTSGADEYRGMIAYQHSSNQFVIKTDTTLALTLDSSQNATFAGGAGIGTSAITGTVQLDVVGAIGGVRAKVTTNNGGYKIYEGLSSGGTSVFSVTHNGRVTANDGVYDSKGDLRKIIQNTQGSAYTLVAADAGKHILASGNITIPNSVFSAGDGVVIVNNTSGDLTITSGITNLYLGTDGSTGNKTLASRCTCTVLFTSGTAGYISGGGLS